MSEDRFITVKAVDTSGRVALFEQDRAHPGGEAFVAGDKLVRIGRTPIVEQKIRDGVLVEVGEVTPEPSATEEPATVQVEPETKPRTRKGE